MRNNQTRAPKQIGDFGEGMVTYVLIRKGYEVAYVDHVGADLIAEKKGGRIAVSVKTRLFRPGSTESRMYCIRHSDIEKLVCFSKRFSLDPVFSLLVCLADEREMHLISVRKDNIQKVFDEVKGGFSVKFGKKHIAGLRRNPLIDYSCWEGEEIGSVEFVAG